MRSRVTHLLDRAGQASHPSPTLHLSSSLKPVIERHSLKAMAWNVFNKFGPGTFWFLSGFKVSDHVEKDLAEVGHLKGEGSYSGALKGKKTSSTKSLKGE